MKNHTRAIACIAFACALFGAAGCASSSRVSQKSDSTSGTRQYVRKPPSQRGTGTTAQQGVTASGQRKDGSGKDLFAVAPPQPLAGSPDSWGEGQWPDVIGQRSSTRDPEFVTGNPSHPASSAGANLQANGATHSRPVGLFGEGIASTSPTRPMGQGNLVQVSFINEGASFDPAVDPAGKRLVFASTMHQSGSNLYIQTVGGSTITQLTADPADDVMPCFSPRGDRIAFSSNRGGNWDIYIVGVDGGPPVQFTNDTDHELHPTWSPDGRYIAYCKFNSQSSRWEIWTVDVENPGLRRFLEYGMFPKWSPDVASSKILFQRPRQRGSRLHGIWTVDFVNGEAMHPTEIVSAANAAAINPSWSPDGKRIAFVTIVDPEKAPADRPEQSDLWVISLDGSGRMRLTDGQFANFQPVWAGDGSIYFISNRSGIDNIWAVATDRMLDMNRPAGIASVPTDRN